MENSIRKESILCQYFKEDKFGRFGVVSTWEETLVCYVPVGGDINTSLDIAMREVISFIEGKISERDFLIQLEEREAIMKALMSKNGIPTDGMLYVRLFEHYKKTEGGYRPFPPVPVNKESEIEHLGEQLKKLINNSRP